MELITLSNVLSYVVVPGALYTAKWLFYDHIQSVSRLATASEGDKWRSELHYYNADDLTQMVIASQGGPLRSRIPLTMEDDMVRIGEMSTDVVGSSTNLIQHTYIVISTSNYYYSIEKLASHILLQRSKEINTVFDKRLGKTRPHPTMNRASQVIGWNIGNLIQFLSDTKQLDSEYNKYTSNCNHFSSMIYKQFAIKP